MSLILGIQHVSVATKIGNARSRKVQVIATTQQCERNGEISRVEYEKRLHIARVSIVLEKKNAIGGIVVGLSQKNIPSFAVIKNIFTCGIHSFVIR